MSSLDDDPTEVAEKRGVLLVLPEPDQLFIDLDHDDDSDWMRQMLGVLRDNGYRVCLEKMTTSPGGNKHAYLRFERPLEPLERVCLQACLGSDRKRELLSFMRIDQRAGRWPTVFFEKPEPAK